MKIDSQEVIVPIMERLDREGYEFNQYNPFGIRNFSDIEKGVYNDTIGLISEKELYYCQGTTDPSPYYIVKKPMNANGTAVMVAGLQQNIWMVGKHGKAKVTALINGWRGGFGTEKQHVRRMDKNYVFKKKIYNGWFACNLHPSFDNNFEYIGRNSAGCQVLMNRKEFNQYMKRILLSKEYLSNKRTLYSYFLFTKDNLLTKELGDFL